uniref:Uncharacterized protein n=1 Tax=Tanacetum cinerariifolium TaxID=118510 RepID=A0A6L2KR98_TANCI|nr:hypothetical protein [Tanacetum cinerariifolium]
MKRKFVERTKKMLTEKWTLMNAAVQKFNQLVMETLVHSGENDENWMTRVKFLYKTHMGSDFKHKSAWLFLKNKHKWTNPESTNARRYLFVLSTKIQSILEMMRCLGHPGYNDLLKVNVWVLTRLLVPVLTDRVSRIHGGTIRVRPQSQNASDRARERRPKAVDPISKDCGGHENSTN